MATNGGAVDALQRELIKGGKGRKKPGPKPKDIPPKKELARLVRELKG